ncbi:MAG: Guanidinobutyrase [uncultured Thermoleophilia bacterium]|uniref:Guanidinobutyrase n=1 Tax=uncultured Thermoleophilia bacterium TaxID=1497501 RepID=A0A6J4UBC4_9ACTN|nr:MAG: Guanidinobutyrase [uncultured Thermoleophilia bacterium]
MHQPVDSLATPRFTGPRTFARLPYVPTLDGVEAAVFGLPWDGGTSFRAGARFGPEAIRSASALLRPYNPDQRVQVFGAVSTIDHGDAPTVPGYIERTLPRLQDFVGSIAAAGVVSFGMGGDHSVTLAELRALAAVHGPLGVVHLDAHSDLWDRYFDLPYNHGTVFRRAIEEGVVDPGRMVQAGLRGSLYAPEDEALAADLGLEAIPWRELAGLSPEAFADRARARVGTGPCFFSFDVDLVDPAFCPGTGTPECGGPTSFQALELVRALHGIDFRGFDVVEVSPPYDGPGQQTALLAATVLYEMLALHARGRADGSAADRRIAATGVGELDDVARRP